MIVLTDEMKSIAREKGKGPHSRALSEFFSKMLREIKDPITVILNSWVSLILIETALKAKRQVITKIVARKHCKNISLPRWQWAANQTRMKKLRSHRGETTPRWLFTDDLKEKEYVVVMTDNLRSRGSLLPLSLDKILVKGAAVVKNIDGQLFAQYYQQTSWISDFCQLKACLKNDRSSITIMSKKGGNSEIDERIQDTVPGRKELQHSPTTSDLPV
jgi:hypothetical protein